MFRVGITFQLLPLNEEFILSPSGHKQPMERMRSGDGIAAEKTLVDDCQQSSPVLKIAAGGSDVNESLEPAVAALGRHGDLQ